MSPIRNANLGNSQARAKRRRLFLIRLYIVLFLLAFIVLGLAILSGSEKVRIQTIIVSGNAAVSSDDVLVIVNRDMAGRYGYLFARNNSLIFPRFTIKADLLNEIKTISDLYISWDSWQQISIKITERKPHSVWCGADPEQADQACFFVDKEGLIYSQAPIFSGTMFIRNYSKISTDNPLGQYFLPMPVYDQIFNLINLLNQKSLRVVSVSFDGIDYKFILENGIAIMFNDKVALEITFQNLFSAMETGNLDLVKDVSTIKYIDLRFDNKIVVGKKP